MLNANQNLNFPKWKYAFVQHLMSSLKTETCPTHVLTGYAWPVLVLAEPDRSSVCSDRDISICVEPDRTI